MGDLQVDLNTALVAVKQKCVDLEEKIRRENEKPQNRGRGYLGVRRYIYALTTKNNENSLQRRGRSLTRVYVEQKFYRSKSVPSPDQVQRLEDCTQDYGKNNEERLEYVETIDAPLEELIKEDQSHHQMISKRLPNQQGEWDHELAVYEEDGASGLLEDRTLTVRAGDHPFGMNQFNEVAEEVSARIAKFFAEKEENHIRTRELSLSVHPVYHQSNGDPYTSFGMSRSRSMGSVAHEARQTSAAPPEPRPRLDQVSSTTKSLSNLYSVDTKHGYHSHYGDYISGYGHYGAALPPPVNQEVLPKMPALPKKREEHIYDQPIARTSSTTNVYNYSSNYERKYDFKSTFPPDVNMPEGYHDYYDPSKFMFLDPKGYYHGNITRPLHYSYSRDYFEKYSDYSGSRRESPVPPPPPPAEPEPQYPVLNRTEELPHCTVHLHTSYPDYPTAWIKLHRHQDIVHEDIVVRRFPDSYDNATRIILTRTVELEHQVLPYPVPEYNPIKYIELHRTQDVEHDPIIIQEFPTYRPYEDQVLIVTFDDEEPEYDEVYVPTLLELHYSRDPDHFEFIPSVPLTPLPPPPPAVKDEIHVAIPVEVIEEPPVPAERHYDEIYIGREALDVSVSPNFNKTDDQKNLGLEKSVFDRVREVEELMKGEERARQMEEEKRRKYEERQNEIREARILEEQQQSYNAYDEIETKVTPAPQPIQVPDAFVIPDAIVIPEKPKRTWQPPPKSEEHIEEHVDKPLGPVIFHELIFQQGILRQKFQEEHRSNMARPVSHPVSRANSRPTTPGIEPKTIDFPRLDEIKSPRDHSDSAGNVDYVHERIQRYNAYDASSEKDSQAENRAHSHVHSNTVNVHTHESHEHHTHTNVVAHSERSQEHRGSVVYDEPHGQVVYDVPHDQEHHYDSVHDHHHGEQSSVHQEHHHHHHYHHHHHHQPNEHDLQLELSQTNQAIRQMSKTNKWEDQEVLSPKQAIIEAHIPDNSPFVQKVQKNSAHAHGSSSSTHVTTTKTTTVLHHSNSLNRQNIPPPLHIQNGNSDSYHDIQQHIHFVNSENSENEQVALQSSKSATSLDYTPVNVGHVKNLAKLFNKPDEKPITTEQVIYRVRAAPPGHHFQTEIKPRPRSVPHIPLDEIELHEHGERDHLSRHHHEMNENREIHHGSLSIGRGVTVTTHQGSGKNIHHNSYYHPQTFEGEEPKIRVRRVYKALEDTSMLSPVSLPSDEPMYDEPSDAHPGF